MCIGMANGGKQNHIAEDGKKVEKLANMLEEAFEIALKAEMEKRSEAK